jgi:hypothetical protein
MINLSPETAGTKIVVTSRILKGDSERKNTSRMECVKGRKETHEPAETGYNHSISKILITTAFRSGEFVTFDKITRMYYLVEKIFKY